MNGVCRFALAVVLCSVTAPVVSARPATPATAQQPPATQPAKKEKSGCAAGGQGAGGWLAFVMLGLALRLTWRRR